MMSILLIILGNGGYVDPHVDVYVCDVVEKNTVVRDDSEFHQLIYWEFIENNFHARGWNKVFKEYELPKSPLSITKNGKTWLIYFRSSLRTRTWWDRELEDQQFLPATQRPQPISPPKIEPPAEGEPDV